MKLRGTLAPGEEVLLATRAHISSLLPAFGYGFFALIAFSFASSISADSKIFGFLGYAIAALGLWQCLKRVLGWVRTSYFLTNYRVVIQRSLRSAAHVSLPLQIIEGIDVKSTALRIAQSAHLNVVVHGEIHPMRCIPQGNDFSREIQNAQSALVYRGNWGSQY